MSGSHKINELVSLVAEIHRREYAIQKQQSAVWQELQDALKHWDQETAKRLFDLVLHWNELQQLAVAWRESLAEPKLNTYVIDAWFAQDLIQYLTPGKDEEIAHVTGPRIGSVRTLSRLCPIKAETKTAVYVKAAAQSCADTEIEIIEHGNLPHAMAHSHPGKGAAATTPSSIDTNYLGNIQRAGSEAIGIIVTRDGWLRFFSVVKPFRVFVMGTGAVQMEEYVFHITPTGQDSNQKNR